MYNYTYTPVTVKVACTILYSPETSLQWAATQSRFPDHSAESTEKVCIGEPLAHFSVSKTGGYGNRTPDLLCRKLERNYYTTSGQPTVRVGSVNIIQTK